MGNKGKERKGKAMRGMVSNRIERNGMEWKEKE
jgi:hypothetical protein